MKSTETKKEIISFWDEHFTNAQAMSITKDDITLDTPLDECLQFLGDNCEKVLDIACGNGLCLIQTKLIGTQIKCGLGFDSSSKAIDNAKKIVSLSNIPNLEFVVGEETFLSSIDKSNFDGIFCSNFLDVIPDDINNRVIREIKRILKPNGYLLLKFNFYLSPELIKRLKMQQVAPDCYAMNGTFRANNKTTEQWLGFFKDYEVIKISGFQRSPNLPEDRLLLLKKLR